MGYTITFFNNGYGQELDPLYNITTIEDLPELTDEGFIFEGWYLDEELTTPVTYKMILTSDIILYAS